MRMMMKVVIETHAGNKAARDGLLGKTMGALSERIKPEAAYFSPDHGNRSAFFIFDMKDPSQIVSIAEPLFQELGAHVTFTPVMNADELQKGLQSITK
jgi:hypothetical protein